MVASITWLTATPGATSTLLSLALNVSASTDFTFSNVTNSSTLLAYAASTTQPEATGSPLVEIGVASDAVPSVLQLRAGQTVTFLSVVHSSLEGIADPLAAAIEHLNMYRKLANSLFSSRT